MGGSFFIVLWNADILAAKYQGIVAMLKRDWFTAQPISVPATLPAAAIAK